MRAEGDARFAAGRGVHLNTQMDGMPIIVATFTEAGKVEEGGPVGDAEIREVFARYVAAPADLPAAGAGQ